MPPSVSRNTIRQVRMAHKAARRLHVVPGTPAPLSHWSTYSHAGFLGTAVHQREGLSLFLSPAAQPTSRDAPSVSCLAVQRQAAAAYGLNSARLSFPIAARSWLPTTITCSMLNSTSRQAVGSGPYPTMSPRHHTSSIASRPPGVVQHRGQRLKVAVYVGKKGHSHVAQRLRLQPPI